MAIPTSVVAAPDTPVPHRATTEPPAVRRLLIGVTLLFLTLFLFVPLAAVFYEALRKSMSRPSPTPTPWRRSGSRSCAPPSRCR